MTTLANFPAGLDLAATVGSDLVLAVTVDEWCPTQRSQW